MPYFTRKQFRQHYQVIEGAASRDTIFLHGNLASNLWWEPSVEIWKSRAKGSGRLILAEWRGCGDSKEFSGALDLQTLAADTLELMDHLNIKKGNLVGHSTGCLIGLHAMAAAPEKFEKAVMLDPVHPEGIQFGPEMRGAFLQMSKDKAFASQIILSTIHGGNLSQRFQERIVDACFQVSPTIWEGVPNFLANVPNLDFSKLQMPILIAHGEMDAVLPIEKSEQLAKELPQGTFVKLKARGHSANVEDPEFFVELCQEFLA
jgi:pimeloyl-ACP methyl ester carboxylesterase